jgi:hypothetical protein
MSELISWKVKLCAWDPKGRKDHRGNVFYDDIGILVGRCTCPFEVIKKMANELWSTKYIGAQKKIIVCREEMGWHRPELIFDNFKNFAPSK